MSKINFISFIAILVTLSNPIHSQTDSLKNDKLKSYKLYCSSGIGFGSRGGTFGLSEIFVSSNNWGGGISYKINILKSKNVPSDYYNDGNRTFAPRDYLSLITLSLIKEFPPTNKSIRFGIEAGASWVKYNVAQFKLNPSYNSANPPWFGNFYKYNKSHTASKTIGLNLRAKAEFAQSRFSNLELAVFSNINNIQPVIGIELYFSLGKIGM